MHLQSSDQSAFYNNSSYQSPPPRWLPYTPFGRGAVVWYAGSFWHCETPHTSGAEPHGTPVNNLHLWTPFSAYPQQQPRYQVPGYAPPPHYPVSTPNQGFFQGQGQGQAPQYNEPHPHIIAPTPLPMPAKPPSTHDDDDSPDSITTVRDDNPPSSSSRGFGFGGKKMDFEYFQNRAAEGMRYLTVQNEDSKEGEKDCLRDELKGKRVWRVGGVGVCAYGHGELGKEGTKQDVWREWGDSHGRDEWIHAARTRTNFYRDTRGLKPLVAWKLVERGGNLPDDALPIGHEADGRVLYAARGWWEGGLHLGKAGPHLINHASIPYGGSEHGLDIYEVLCAPSDPSLIKWMTFRHGERAMVEGWMPVEGGREKDGTPLLLAKGEFENGEHPGKCLIGDDHACIGWGGGELWVRPFQVLAFCTPNRR